MNLERETVRRYVPLFVVVPVLLAYAALVTVAPESTSIRAGYVVVAAVVSLPIFYATTTPEARPTDQPVPHVLFMKVVLSLGALTVAATALTGSRIVPLVVFLPVGYLAVAYQLWRGPPVWPFLLELMTLHAVPLIGKYLTAGFYYGGSDTLVHIGYVDSLLAQHHLGVIGGNYGLYPGFEILVATVRVFTGLPTYDAIVLTGIATFTSLVPASYLLSYRLLGNRSVALGTALAFTVLSLFEYYSMYFFPQSLAVVLLVVGFYVYTYFLELDGRYPKRYVPIITALVAAMSITHHLTYVLLVVPVAAVVVVLFGKHLITAVAKSGLPDRPTEDRFVMAFPLIFGSIVLVAYWQYAPSIFIERLFDAISGTLNATSDGGPSSFFYGVPEPPPNDAGRAARWLASPSGNYFSLLGAVLLVGLYELVVNVRAYWHRIALVGGGLLAAGVLLPLPIGLPAIRRIQFVASLFALLPLGVGIARVVSIPSIRRGSRYAVAGLLVLAALGTAASFTTDTGDDLEAVHTEEYRQHPSFTERERRMLGETATFLRQYATSTVTTSHVLDKSLQGNGYDPAGVPELRSDGMHARPGLLVVRDAWPEREVTVGTGATGNTKQFVTSERRFETAIANRNKVYTSGEVSVLWNPAPYEGVFGRNATHNRSQPSPEAIDRSALRNR